MKCFSTLRFTSVIRCTVVLATVAFSSSTLAALHAPLANAATSHLVRLSLPTTVLRRINAIRTSRHLPSGVATSAYNSEVVQSIRTSHDPPFARVTGGIVGEESLWGVMPDTSLTTAPSPVSIVNAWVYHDGWMGSTALTWNVDCISPLASGCNGHRRAVLSAPPVRGAKLYIDVATKNVMLGAFHAVAVAALMVWKMPPPATPTLSLQLP